MENLSTLIGLCILAWVCYWVVKDARSRGMDGTGWAIGVFLLLIVFLPLYFMFRKPKLVIEEKNENLKS